MQIEQQHKPTPFLVFAITILALVNMQDGFDILAIAFAAESISRDWGISRSELGVVFSAGLFGMMIGAMFLAALADRFGRKIIAIVGLVLSGSGMLLAMSAGSLEVLIAARVLTGIGVGGILATVNTLAAEYAGPKYRVAAVSFFQLGFAFGAFVSGFLALWLLSLGGWRYVFAFGAFTSFAFIPFIMFLPESTSFLRMRGRKADLKKIDQIERKFGRQAQSDFRVQASPAQNSFWSSLVSLFRAELALKTLLIWTSFFLLLTTLYFLLSWIPKIIIDLGFTEAEGNRAGRLINLAGLVGIIVIGALGARVKPALITSLYLVLMAIALALFNSLGMNFNAILIGVAFLGIFAHGSMVGLYSTVPNLYPTSVRATGTGWAIGISRLGAVVGPLIAGFLLDAGWVPQDIFKLFAIPTILAAGTTFMLWKVQKQEERRFRAALSV